MTSRRLRRRTLASTSLAAVAGMATLFACTIDAPTVPSGEAVTGTVVPTGTVTARYSFQPDVDAGPPKPLVLIDGLEVGKVDLAEYDLAPETIERIEVLKGEAAARAFGERGANGVVQIFRKREGGATATATARERN